MKYFEAFAGVGGFSQGINNAYDNNRPDVRNGATDIQKSMPGTTKPQGGATCIGFSEIDKYASQVLRYRFPNIKNYGDIRGISAGTLPDFDLLVGGFPCQTFSIAGKRAGFEDTRGTLFFEMARVAKEKKPKFWLAENVKGLVSHDGGKTLSTILATMQELGYAVTVEIINAKNYGVPQNRERLFMLGTHIPTIWKEVQKDGIKTKKDSFVKIIKGFLFQLLLNRLAEVQKLQGAISKDLVCGLLILSAIIELGQKKKWTYSNPTSKSLCEKLRKSSLKEVLEQFTTKQGRLGEKQDMLDGILTGKAGNKYLSVEEKVWESIALLLSDGLEENLQAVNKSTISTLITRTTEMKIFTFASMLRAIASFTLLLRSSSSHLWNEVLSDLIILKVGTNYEPITDKDDEKVIGRSGFVRRSNLSATYRERIFVVGTRTRCPREVFFEAGTTSEDNEVFCPTIREGDALQER